MASGLEEPTGSHPQPSSSSCSSATTSDNNDNDSANFECNICFELAQDPVVTLCGHLFCWPCLYRWLNNHARSQECPVCKAIVEEDKIVPLYGRGKPRSDPRTRPIPEDTPHRPSGLRPPTARPPPDPNHFMNWNPWFMGGAFPFGGVRFGNYTFSAAIGGLIPLLSFQVHGYPDAHAYGQAAGFHYGHNPFHGGNDFGVPQRGSHDSFLKFMLLALGFLVVAYLIW